MRLKRKLLTAITALTLMFAGGAIASLPAYAAPSGGGGGAACPSGNTAKGQVLQGLGQTGSNCDDSQINKTIKTIVNILSLVVGIASVMVIIISGFKYIASGGDQNKVSSAKNTLLYALIGVAIAALAQVMIHFVLYQTNK